MLAEKRCEACSPGSSPLSPTRAAELTAQLDASWELKDDKIVRMVKTKSFAESFSLATPIALLAENQGHHPDLRISWGRLEISLKTHVANGLTENDFIIAAGIDRILR